VFYDALPGQLQNENAAVRSYRLDPDKIGSALIDFCQGDDDDYENIKRSTALSWTGSSSHFGIRTAIDCRNMGKADDVKGY
jgi:hypothetical protein